MLFIMSNVTKLELVTFNIVGKNCLSWVIDADILDTMGLGDSQYKKSRSNVELPQENVFPHHHLP